jgi:DNA-directed RNA polymerase specialized sigma subunit
MTELATKEAARRRKASPRGQRDLELWQQWKTGGEKPDDYRELRGNFRGLIRSHVNRYEGNVEVPPIAIRAEYNKQFTRALDTYDPTKGAALATWVSTNLQKAQRWIGQTQDTVRIGEDRYYKVGDFQHAQARLEEKFNREATDNELAEELQWSPKRVEKMQQEKRRSTIASMWEKSDDTGMDPAQFLPSREREVLRFLRQELSPEEQQVFDYTQGANGKPKLRPQQIAQKIGRSPATVTRLRQAIDLKAKKHMGSF